MKPRPKPQDSGTQELFRAKLRNIINLQHELVRLGELIDWQRLEAHFAPYYREAGRPGLPIRLVVGLHLLKHIEGLSDEAVCERWERDPYMQYFCGEEYFQHAFPLERSGMTHFRKRVGEEALETLLQETLAAAYRGGALSVRATEAVAVDTTVQEKAIAHPTEHGLLLTAIEQLGRQAKKTGLRLRQSYVRVARRAAMKTGRYLHAQQKRRAKRQVKFLWVRLRRLIRDVRRKIAALPALGRSPAFIRRWLMPRLKKKYMNPEPVVKSLAPVISSVPMFLSVEHEAGAYLGVTEWTIRRLIRSGKLVAKRIGRRLIVKRADLDALWESEPVFAGKKKAA